MFAEHMRVIALLIVVMVLLTIILWPNCQFGYATDAPEDPNDKVQDNVVYPDFTPDEIIELTSSLDASYQ